MEDPAFGADFCPFEHEALITAPTYASNGLHVMPCSGVAVAAVG